MALIEVLVVITVIGLLAGLLLPAVQGAREAARRAQCVANLKQIGVALQNYESVHRMYPSSQLVNRWGFTTNCMSELAFLLPHLEQQALYASINMDFADLEAADTPSLENHTARNTRVALFLCPSDGEPNHSNSYRFNRGRFSVGRYHNDGPFSIGVLPRPANISDGLSRTAFVSERVGGTFVLDEPDRVRNVKVWNNPSTPIRSDAQFIPLCLAAPQNNWEHTSGRYWFYSGVANSHYNHNGTPNDRRPSCGTGYVRDSFGYGLHPPRSFHPGLVGVLFGDGHVEAITDSIQEQSWIALGTYGAGDSP
jgi:prepilin-type processing-associated H-X9-DG protein